MIRSGKILLILLLEAVKGNKLGGLGLENSDLILKERLIIAGVDNQHIF